MNLHLSPLVLVLLTVFEALEKPLLPRVLDNQRITSEATHLSFLSNRRELSSPIISNQLFFTLTLDEIAANQIKIKI